MTKVEWTPEWLAETLKLLRTHGRDTQFIGFSKPFGGPFHVVHTKNFSLDTNQTQKFESRHKFLCLDSNFLCVDIKVYV